VQLCGNLRRGSAQEQINYSLAARQMYEANGGIENKYPFNQRYWFIFLKVTSYFKYIRHISGRDSEQVT
jgi:hypothetical protein